jgi:hypothetical protein
MSINKENYDSYVNKSFFTEKNFSGKYDHKTISNNMIPYENLREFHYQTSFFLNFYAGLYIELKKHESSTILYDITKFAKHIENLGIIIDNQTLHSGTAYGTNHYLTTFVIDNSDTTSNTYNYKFYVKTFEAFLTTQSNLYTNGSQSSSIPYDSGYNDILEKSKPHFGDYPNTLIPNTTTNINYLIKKNASATLSLTDSLKKETFKKLMPDNKSKFMDILDEIFSQTPQNILGYLLNKKIYYNIVLFNISIQNSIRLNYLNETGSTPLLINTADSSLITTSTSNVSNIILNITDNTNNITKLNEIHFKNKNNNNEYLVEKTQYINKINILNNLRDEYIKTQDKLNISTKLYNQQFKNYKSIKSYATYIIIALILIIISIISISVFPIFSIETKNALFIILLIILIVITFLYYTNFKYVNLYENFASVTISDAKALIATNVGVVPVSASTDKPGLKKQRNNNIVVYNHLLPKINEYSNAYNDLLNNMRLNIYTIGSKTFSQDANIYIYNLYLEKKRQIEVNKVKLTNLFNMIEVLKKQINYLFNVIFLIACVSIILLLALVIYSTAPQLLTFIIILCVVLISILMIYFAIAIIQPTRMIANKNYWANLNPSKTTYSKL